MKLIVESGATKTDYCILGNNKSLSRFRTEGLNLATMSVSNISNVLRKAVSEISVPDEISEIFFYGAGLVSSMTGQAAPASVSEELRILDSVLREEFKNVSAIEYNSDLTASARALWGNRPGIAVILGTGSNSCLYDGCKVGKNVRPCGYIIGDFGSGAALGKIFMADYLQHLMPDELYEKFGRDYGLDYQSVVKAIYGGDAPARFLASFSPYILSLARDSELSPDSLDYLRQIITDNFRIFIRRCLMQYDPCRYMAGVTGSFGCAAKEYLEAAGAEYGIRFSEFLPSPMDGLIKYHSDNV